MESVSYPASCPRQKDFQNISGFMSESCRNWYLKQKFLFLVWMKQALTWCHFGYSPHSKWICLITCFFFFYRENTPLSPFSKLCWCFQQWLHQFDKHIIKSTMQREHVHIHAINLQFFTSCRIRKKSTQRIWGTLWELLWDPKATDDQKVEPLF